MYILLVIIAVIVCVLLGFIVLIQNPKGGGLSSNFSSSSQLMGVQKTGDFLEKGTWVLAITLMVISLAMNVISKTAATADSKSQQNEQIQKASKPQNSGASPMALPGAQQAQPAQQQPTAPAPVKKP